MVGNNTHPASCLTSQLSLMPIGRRKRPHSTPHRSRPYGYAFPSPQIIYPCANCGMLVLSPGGSTEGAGPVPLPIPR